MKMNRFQITIVIVMVAVLIIFPNNAENEIRVFGSIRNGGWAIELYKFFGVLSAGVLLFLAASNLDYKK